MVLGHRQLLQWALGGNRWYPSAHPPCPAPPPALGLTQHEGEFVVWVRGHTQLPHLHLCTQQARAATMRNSHMQALADFEGRIMIPLPLRSTPHKPFPVGSSPTHFMDVADQMTMS